MLDQRLIRINKVDLATKGYKMKSYTRTTADFSTAIALEAVMIEFQVQLREKGARIARHMEQFETLQKRRKNRCL
ncbi:hypothetical protein SAMN02745127_01908 [Oceanospirillum multiglobuliferum]|nr:hypothetical protein SAMN02745127_01908 [Oceanospirillum multiglobuliferum]